MALIVDHSVPTEKNMSIHLRFRLFAARKKKKANTEGDRDRIDGMFGNPFGRPKCGGFKSVDQNVGSASRRCRRRGA